MPLIPNIQQLWNTPFCFTMVHLDSKAGSIAMLQRCESAETPESVMRWQPSKLSRSSDKLGGNPAASNFTAASPQLALGQVSTRGWLAPCKSCHQVGMQIMAVLDSSRDSTRNRAKTPLLAAGKCQLAKLSPEFYRSLASKCARLSSKVHFPRSAPSTSASFISASRFRCMACGQASTARVE